MRVAQPIEQHLRVKQVAERLGISPQSVRRKFKDRPGVKVFGDAAGSRRKRPYSLLLIPESLVDAVLREMDLNG